MCMVKTLLEPGVRDGLLCVFETLVPAVPCDPPNWCRQYFGDFITWLLFREGSTTKLVQAEDDRHPDEAWIYVNGVGTGMPIAVENAKRLVELFGRSITVVHNPTDSFIVDLLECVAGKLKLMWWWKVEPVGVVLRTVEQAFDQGKTKVVLIGHSQGTIIVNNVLDRIARKHINSPPDLKAQKKLEVYLFADCAHHIDTASLEQHSICVESLCNSYDTVALLGGTYPRPETWRDVTEEQRVVNKRVRVVVQDGKGGHLLNTHYLDNFANEYKGSRLHQYLVNS
mmetsp:Transcript_17910/g.50953  ORF Transcript_17910/g.50953 Transcript_17910/m.50953 type:complete len:283 (-) Transcript_17910:951-1799(-)